MHRVVGTPRFMTHTESAGRLLRPGRSAATHRKKKRDNTPVITQTGEWQMMFKREMERRRREIKGARNGRAEKLNMHLDHALG